MRFRLFFVGSCVAVLLLFGLGCAASHPNVAYQNSTIDALLDGNYDGDVTFARLARHGDFGLGTFNELDGEMIALGGRFYQVRSDGRASEVSPGMKTPFSVVTFFGDHSSATLEGTMSYAQLQQRLDAFRPVAGHAYAFAIEGAFDIVRTRSVPRQTPPYARLAEVVKHQATFDLKHVRGTLVGFWFPESMRHVNVPGYHFHFISEDRSTGGHVLQLTLNAATVRTQRLDTITIALPRTPPSTQPGGDHSDELERVEK